MKKLPAKSKPPPLEVATDLKLKEQITIRLTLPERNRLDAYAAAWSRKPGPYARLALLYVMSHPELEQAIMGRPREGG